MRILGIFRFPLNFSCTCRRPLPPARSGSAAGIFALGQSLSINSSGIYMIEC
ncbi:hypothetical protein SLEP1_g24584 [Rubroshorea leprosula]|uniref:Uncharacterized protein n=1 Tax=Rubroshorea leprosula TaxID=152421 RepID=A0AAV5JS87_9ROSI|nr:hypothetical protein SLEP1_g24584 [Rubroshorea leprosula]